MHESGGGRGGDGVHEGGDGVHEGGDGVHEGGDGVHEGGEEVHEGGPMGVRMRDMRKGGTFICLLPAHNDAKPSSSITLILPRTLTLPELFPMHDFVHMNK